MQTVEQVVRKFTLVFLMPAELEDMFQVQSLCVLPPAGFCLTDKTAMLISSDADVILIIAAGLNPTIVSLLCQELCVCVSFTMNYPEGEMDCVNVTFEARTWMWFVMSPLRLGSVLH